MSDPNLANRILDGDNVIQSDWDRPSLFGTPQQIRVELDQHTGKATVQVFEQGFVDWIYSLLSSAFGDGITYGQVRETSTRSITSLGINKDDLTDKTKSEDLHTRIKTAINISCHDHKKTDSKVKDVFSQLITDVFAKLHPSTDSIVPRDPKPLPQNSSVLDPSISNPTALDTHATATNVLRAVPKPTSSVSQPAVKTPQQPHVDTAAGTHDTATDILGSLVTKKPVADTPVSQPESTKLTEVRTTLRLLDRANQPPQVKNRVATLNAKLNALIDQPVKSTNPSAVQARTQAIAEIGREVATVHVQTNLNNADKYSTAITDLLIHSDKKENQPQIQQALSVVNKYQEYLNNAMKNFPEALELRIAKEQLESNLRAIGNFVNQSMKSDDDINTMKGVVSSTLSQVKDTFFKINQLYEGNKEITFSTETFSTKKSIEGPPPAERRFEIPSDTAIRDIPNSQPDSQSVQEKVSIDLPDVIVDLEKSFKTLAETTPVANSQETKSLERKYGDLINKNLNLSPIAKKQLKETLSQTIKEHEGSFAELETKLKELTKDLVSSNPAKSSKSTVSMPKETTAKLGLQVALRNIQTTVDGAEKYSKAITNLLISDVKNASNPQIEKGRAAINEYRKFLDAAIKDFPEASELVSAKGEFESNLRAIASLLNQSVSNYKETLNGLVSSTLTQIKETVSLVQQLYEDKNTLRSPLKQFLEGASADHRFEIPRTMAERAMQKDADQQDEATAPVHEQESIDLPNLVASAYEQAAMLTLLFHLEGLPSEYQDLTPLEQLERNEEKNDLTAEQKQAISTQLYDEYKQELAAIDDNYTYFNSLINNQTVQDLLPEKLWVEEMKETIQENNLQFPQNDLTFSQDWKEMLEKVERHREMAASFKEKHADLDTFAKAAKGYYAALDLAIETVANLKRREIPQYTAATKLEDLLTRIENRRQEDVETMNSRDSLTDYTEALERTSRSLELARLEAITSDTALPEQLSALPIGSDAYKAVLKATIEPQIEALQDWSDYLKEIQNNLKDMETKGFQFPAAWVNQFNASINESVGTIDDLQKTFDTGWIRSNKQGLEHLTPAQVEDYQQAVAELTAKVDSEIGEVADAFSKLCTASNKYDDEREKAIALKDSLSDEIQEAKDKNDAAKEYLSDLGVQHNRNLIILLLEGISEADKTHQAIKLASGNSSINATRDALKKVTADLKRIRKDAS